MIIIAVNWLWQRRASHTMFQVLLNRYLLNLGTPFEHYLISLSGPAAQGLEPEDYLEKALEAMHELEWIEGVEARGTAGGRLVGSKTANATEAWDEVLPLVVYTRQEPGPALRLHIQLLARLVQQLYQSRVQEAELRNQEKARVVHETGARLTHDIKNLLQSLQSLTSAVVATPPERAGEAAELVQRQLPYINQRLQATLEKLRDPADADHGEPVPLDEWWRELEGRYGNDMIGFEGEPPGGLMVPRDLFDTVAENLIENARYKQSGERDLAIQVELEVEGLTVSLRVSDSGEAVPDRVARYLFGGAVPSSSGLGVGLYQCGRLATYYGFTLRLEENRRGNVTFLLQGPADSA
ncbi:MAG: HAMP domain-containing sensor histidine kinase [Halofilum sp. (in: g-proteobacteria)]|nr:HAMP domain-containing sensor histidine kinase [Halofilum sp. (in: g-proteobacteria)]